MTRSCIALTLFLLVLAGSLFAIRSAQGQNRLDPRLGAARSPICPLLGDEFHGCGFQPSPHPAEGPSFATSAKSRHLTERLCPLALPSEVQGVTSELPGGQEAGWRAIAEHPAAWEADENCCAGYSTPPADPYPLYSLLGTPVAADAEHARYLSGHDPAYDAIVYGQPLPQVPAPPQTNLLPAEVAEACRRPLTYIFVLEETPGDTNYGYRPAQLDEAFGTRGAFRALQGLPEKWIRELLDSALFGHLECRAADLAFRARRALQSPEWRAITSATPPAHVATGRPMVTRQVVLDVPRPASRDDNQAPLSNESAQPSEVTREAGAARPALSSPQRLLVKSLASSLDHTGRLLQNASRHLEGLLENDTF